MHKGRYHVHRYLLLQSCPVFTSAFFIQKSCLQVLHFCVFHIETMPTGSAFHIEILSIGSAFHTQIPCLQPLHFIHRYHVYSFCISYIETMSIGFCVSAYHIQNMSIEFPEFCICIYHQANAFIGLNNKNQRFKHHAYRISAFS